MQLPITKFSFETLASLTRKIIGKNDSVEFELSDAINYVSQYFFTTTDGNYLFWEPLIGDFRTYDKNRVKELYFNRMPLALSKWFFTQNTTLYKMDCNSQRPRIYKDMDGEGVINGFRGFMHEAKPFDKYPQASKDAVHLFLSFIKEVLSNGNEASYEYLVKWIASLCRGIKLDSCIYMKGIEGIGKSSLTDFLLNHVLGPRASTKSNSDPLRTPYNKLLFGYPLIVFEELPTFSSGEWEGISSKLKDLVTSNVCIYSDKFEKSYQASNISSYIINSNVEALKSSDGRRYYIADISTKRLGDAEYFTTLYDTCFNNKVGEAFFSYLSEIDVSQFRGQKSMPETKHKNDAISDRLDNVYKFLKDEYVLKKRGIKKQKVGDVYDEYCLYLPTDRKPITKTMFCRKMEEIGIQYRKSNGHNIYDINCEFLLLIATKKRWLHELDEFINTVPCPSDVATERDTIEASKDQLIEELMDKNKSLQDKIDELMRRLDAKEQAIEKPIIVIEAEEQVMVKAVKSKSKPKAKSPETESVQKATKPKSKPKAKSPEPITESSSDDDNDEETKAIAKTDAENVLKMIW